MNYQLLELMHLQAAALYSHDAEGRLLRVNEPDPNQPAPRFFLARSAHGNLWRTRYDLPPELAAELARLAASEPVVADLPPFPLHQGGYVALLEQYAPVTRIYAGPAYWLPELAPSSRTVTITPQNEEALLRTHIAEMIGQPSEHAPIVVVVEDGVAVAGCVTARTTDKVAEAGVLTVKSYRGRGYAAEVVRGWAAQVRASRRLPLYSTWWENTASQRVAAKLGAVQYGVWFSLT